MVMESGGKSNHLGPACGPDLQEIESGEISRREHVYYGMVCFVVFDDLETTGRGGSLQN